MAAFFEAMESDEKAKKARNKTPEDVQRKANIHYGMALDKGFMAHLGVGLLHFLPMTRLLPLQDGESRYLVEVDTPVGPQTKSCIENDQDGSRRIEHPLQYTDGLASWEPTLYFAADRCAVGRQLLDFFQVGLGRP